MLWLQTVTGNDVLTVSVMLILSQNFYCIIIPGVSTFCAIISYQISLPKDGLQAFVLRFGE